MIHAPDRGTRVPRRRRGMFWTDVYPFFTDKAAGITGSQPYRDASGELVAVLGVDVKRKHESLPEGPGYRQDRHRTDRRRRRPGDRASARAAGD